MYNTVKQCHCPYCYQINNVKGGDCHRCATFQILRFCVILKNMEVIVKCVPSAFRHGKTEANIRYSFER